MNVQDTSRPASMHFSASRISRLLVLTVSLCGTLPAQDYKYHPSSKLKLGVGFDPRTLEAKAECFDYTEKQRGTENAAALSTFDVSAVESSHQLFQALNIDYRTDARYLVFKGSATFNFDLKRHRKKNSLTVVIVGSTTYHDLDAKDATLKAPYRALIDQGKHAAFARQCGTVFVSSATRGNSVSIVLTIDQIEDSIRSKIKASAEGGASVEIASASAKYALEGEIARASNERRLTMSVLATGGEGFAALGGVLTTQLEGKSSLEQLRQEMGKYVKSFEAKPAFTGYKTISMEVFGWDAKQQGKLPYRVDSRS